MHGTSVEMFTKHGHTFEAVARRAAREIWSGCPKVPKTFPVAGACSLASAEEN
jgi:hypothetical protein